MKDVYNSTHLTIIMPRMLCTCLYMEIIASALSWLIHSLRTCDTKIIRQQGPCSTDLLVLRVKIILYLDTGRGCQFL